jgi:hypothetical protein
MCSPGSLCPGFVDSPSRLHDGDSEKRVRDRSNVQMGYGVHKDRTSPGSGDRSKRRIQIKTSIIDGRFSGPRQGTGQPEEEDEGQVKFRLRTKGRVKCRTGQTGHRSNKTSRSLPDHQLTLTPLVAPAPPFPPPAPPKKTGSSFLPVSVATHAPSKSDAARAKTGPSREMSAGRPMGGLASWEKRLPFDIATVSRRFDELTPYCKHRSAPRRIRRHVSQLSPNRLIPF